MDSFAIFANFFSESPPQLLLHSEKCLRSRLNTNQCTRCLKNCPSKALSIVNRKVCIDMAQCTGCMSCVAACPQDALVSDYDLDVMLSSCQSAADVVVSCIHQTQNQPNEMTIPCVGILSKEVLAALLLNDYRSVSFNVAGCTGCANQDVSNVFMMHCKQIIEELSGINLTKMVLIEDNDQLSNPKKDRRSYLTKIRDIAVDVSKQRFFSMQDPPLTESRTSRSIPFKTQLVKKVFASLDGGSQQAVLGLFGHNLLVHESCNCCPLCKGICPTGAIKIDRLDQGTKLRFEMLDCSGCGLCVEFCKINALSLERYDFVSKLEK